MSKIILVIAALFIVSSHLSLAASDTTKAKENSPEKNIEINISHVA